MRDIVKEYQKKFRRNHQRARRYTALLLALALTTSLFVNWQLHGVGIAKTADYLCGELEHEHTAACYEKQLVCGYEEGEPEDWNATMTDDGMSLMIHSTWMMMRSAWMRMIPALQPIPQSRSTSLCPMSTPTTATRKCRS